VGAPPLEDAPGGAAAVVLRGWTVAASSFATNTNFASIPPVCSATKLKQSVKAIAVITPVSANVAIEAPN
jgi:hypothetical protein